MTVRKQTQDLSKVGREHEGMVLKQNQLFWVD